MTKKYSFLLPLLIIVFSCKKETERQDSNIKLAAFFSMTKHCNPRSLPEDLQYTDSTIFFNNQSTFLIGNDTTQIKSYKWDFGDNSNSTEINPAHIYSKSGIYRIVLTTYLNNNISDSISQNIHIIIGQKEYKSNMNYTQAIDFDETIDGGALILVSSFNSYNDVPTYNLLKVDSLLNKKWMKPIIGSNIRLNSLKKINPSEYILSGNYSTGNADLFSISKIDSGGNLIWAKSLSNILGKNNYTQVTSDGGFLTIGNSSITSNYYSIVVKFDANGNEIWHKYFNGSQTLQNANNIIETPTGYMFASIITGFFNSQIVVTKLDYNGNVLQQTSTITADASTIFTAGISHISNTYLVYTTNARYIYLFDESLSFLGNQLIGESGLNDATARGNKFYIAEGNFQYSFIKQLSLTGAINWSSIINHSIPTSCSGLMSGATRYCKKTLCTNANEVLALSYGQNDPNSSNSSSVYIEKFNINGTIK